MVCPTGVIPHLLLYNQTLNGLLPEVETVLHPGFSPTKERSPPRERIQHFLERGPNLRRGATCGITNCGGDLCFVTHHILAKGADSNAQTICVSKTNNSTKLLPAHLNIPQLDSAAGPPIPHHMGIIYAVYNTPSRTYGRGPLYDTAIR